MDHKDLQIWQRSTDLAVSTYEYCKNLPDYEKYGLVSQMQRASISIPSNIAEGYRRNSKKEFSHFLSIAAGSAAELETQLIICEKIYNTKATQMIIESVEIQRMILSFQKSLKIR